MKLSILQMVVIAGAVILFAGMALGTPGLPVFGLGALIIVSVILWKTRDYKQRRYRKVLQSRHDNFSELWKYRDEEADRKKYGV